MRFSQLAIKNFRSIGPDGVTVTFDALRNLCALIGSNASGKSNVLQALAIVLGVFPFSRFDAEETDFHAKDTNKEILIEITLAAPLTERDVYQRGFDIHGFRFRAWRRIRGDGKGVLAQEHYCFGRDGKTIAKPTRIYKSTQKAEEKDFDNTQRPLQARDYAWKLGNAFYLDVPRLERFFDKTTGWTPLGRLFDLYRDDFPADHNVYDLPDGKKIKSRDAFNQLAGDLARILRTAKLEEIESSLSKRIGEYVGGTARDQMKVGFGLPSHRDVFEKWVALQVTERSDMPPLPVTSLGSGYCALFRLAVIETLLDLSQEDGGHVLLIEEPEIYLHTHLRRYFARVVRRMAEKGNQIVLATHAPEFVDLAEPHEIVRLHKVAGQTLTRQIPSGEAFEFQKAKQKIRRLGNEDLLFANHAILTEGQDDQGVTEAVIQARGVDSDVHSISIVNCDSAGNLPDYIKLCSHLAIDFYVIHDEDNSAKDVSQKRRNERIAEAVSATSPKNPSLHLYTPDLEATMGKTKHCGLDMLLACLDGKDYGDIGSQYPELVKPVEEFLATRFPQSGKTSSTTTGKGN